MSARELSEVGVFAEIDLVLFERSHEALANCVVGGFRRSTHADPSVVSAQHREIVIVEVLAATI